MIPPDGGTPVHDATLSLTAACQQAAADEPPELDLVFERYLDPVYRFLYARLGNRQDAEDLTSEVFVKATRQLDRSRSEASVARWLFTVARTVLVDHWRRYYQGGAPLPFDDQRVAEIPTPIDADPVDEHSRMVAELLDLLPERYRQVLDLRFLRGYSILETAQELNLTPENVKVIQHRALAKAVQVAGERS